MDIIIVLCMIIIPAVAQFFVTTSYSKFSNVKNGKKLTGFDVARKILDAHDLNHMYIVETKGTLSDHYDPNQKVVRLSKDIYHGESIASIAVAAHECGHAIQDQEGYTYMRFRSFLFPVVHITTTFSYLIIALGVLFQSLNLIWVGIAFVGTGLLFQIVTLPVEIDASKRALKELEELSLAKEEERNDVKSMLIAAASTYIAGVLSSALELLRLILAFQNKDN